MKLKLSIHHNGQLALLADKKTQMRSLGEIDITVLETSTQNIILRLRALVVSNLGVECYGGQTFHLDNGIVDNICTRTISIHHGNLLSSSRLCTCQLLTLLHIFLLQRKMHISALQQSAFLTILFQLLCMAKMGDALVLLSGPVKNGMSKTACPQDQRPLLSRSQDIFSLLVSLILAISLKTITSSSCQNPQ